MKKRQCKLVSIQRRRLLLRTRDCATLARYRRVESFKPGMNHSQFSHISLFHPGLHDPQTAQLPHDSRHEAVGVCWRQHFPATAEAESRINSYECVDYAVHTISFFSLYGHILKITYRQGRCFLLYSHVKEEAGSDNVACCRRELGDWEICT